VKSRTDSGHISVPPRVYKQLKRIAAAEGVSMRAWLDYHLNAFLDRKGWQ
jgi:hypothetical protein